MTFFDPQPISNTLTFPENITQKSYLELIETRTRLQEELGRKLRKKYTPSQKLFYEFGNKCGHLLAQALRTKKAKNTVHQIDSPLGKTINNK